MEIVLFEPQIPQNTGSIARTCAAMQVPLHIVGPTPFEITEKKVKRAGLDYWPHVLLSEHNSWSSFAENRKGRNFWIIETNGSKLYSEVTYDIDDILIFGGEVSGVSKEVQDAVGEDRIVKIPMHCSGVRSLNLSNSVSIVLFEALRQCGFPLPHTGKGQ